jgi:undecaprenyl-diphosphatase
MSDLFLSFILGLIQGLTEFLPISSSAHLLFPSSLFGTNDLGLSFDIAVHAGTLVAVIYYFRSELTSMTVAVLTNTENVLGHRKLSYQLILATLPIVFFGLLASDLVNNNRDSLENIALANIIFAALLLLAYKFSSRSKELIQLSVLAAIFIGFFQVFALFPGASRSGIAITAALLIGLNLKDASRFAFLLAIPTILGALVFLLKDIILFDESINLLPMFIGFITSMIFAFITIKYFLAFVERIGMYPFVIYRVFLGALLVLLI